MIEKRIHRLKYKAFYKILQDDSAHIQTITFDCQKNQALPKWPDQSAYYRNLRNKMYDYTTGMKQRMLREVMKL